MAESADYRVDLDIYNGPLDLLLYLIREQELDIHDIPIAQIADQFLAHLDIVRHIDVDRAGDFLLMAATLMLIKSRTLLPGAVADEDEYDEELDPRTDLVRQGSIFQSTSDSEVIVHLIARSDARQVEDQILDALERLEGAYSVLLTVGRTLYAIVDPRGFRPLAVGRLGNGWVLASETCALDLVGARLTRELGPGEWLKIEDGEVVDLPPLPSKPPSRCVFELIYFSRPDSTVFGRSVDHVRRALGQALAHEHPAPGADCVFSVPDSANAMALGFAEASGLKLENGLIRNHYVGRTFINPGQQTRVAKVRIKFNPVQEVIAGRSVVVVDDSLVRGTTSRELVQMLRQAGAREVHFRFASPPITGPCFYGIDTPTREELIASSHTIPQIQAHLGVDSLGYLSLDGLLRAAESHDHYCHACFSGDYPTLVRADSEHHAGELAVGAAREI